MQMAAVACEAPGAESIGGRNFRKGLRRDPVKKEIILIDNADPLHECLNGLIGLLAVNRLGCGSAAKLSSVVRKLVARELLSSISFLFSRMKPCWMRVSMS
jgi:hypothetical protein